MISDLSSAVKDVIKTLNIPFMDYAKVLGEISALVYASWGSKLLKLSTDIHDDQSLETAIQAGEWLKVYKASMKVEEWEELYRSPSVIIGRALYLQNEDMKVLFRKNAKISKAGDDNSDLIEVYEEAMNNKINLTL